MSQSNTHTNVDAEEIEKFNSIASAWWDLEGEFKPLHLLNPARLSYIQEKAEGLGGKNILDIGCGGGILTESMAKLCAAAQGIDLATDSINVAKLHALEHGIDNVQYSIVAAEQHAEEFSETYDVVTCMEMLEHVPDPCAVIAAAAQAAKPGANVFFSTLNKTMKSYLLAIVGAEKVMKLVPDGTHDFDKFIKPAELIRWAEQCGLKVRGSIGLHYNPFNDVVSLKPDLSVNYILHFEKLA